MRVNELVWQQIAKSSYYVIIYQTDKMKYNSFLEHAELQNYIKLMNNIFDHKNLVLPAWKNRTVI